jgi:hypothetical protein
VEIVGRVANKKCLMIDDMVDLFQEAIQGKPDLFEAFLMVHRLAMILFLAMAVHAAL